ncbi:PE domain-containing protein [Actinomycetospora chibensis]|uniref:PE domain-containing protein n=1 Tax=Actinomycetospora chibensis TaxID=663606 RepID=A0ABV9RC32_9PSEU|nr:PE domain-containing protein [Actinomycetospora chibensis]MDD7924157.1 PE domain-containing protein [Actinomycetospora chibensis]
MTQPVGGSFAVDIARAPKAIRELEQAREELRSIKNEAQALGQVNPPARDQVSLDAAQLLGQVATGGATSFMQALDDGIQEVSRMIESLRAGFEAYRAGDAENEDQLRQLS